MTTTLTPLGGSSTTVIAEDILAKDGGVIRRRGPVSLVQNVENGFPLMRQHMGGTGVHRPAPSLSSYPNGLLLQGIGQEVDGYGSEDSGTGTYINLERAREGVYVSMSWWWGIVAQSADAVGDVFFYCDTEGWGSERRSYFTAQLTLATGELRIRNDAGAYILVATVPVPGWNDNKYDRHYTRFTVYIGPSTDVGEDFGRYVEFQIGATVVDLRSAGGGSADYEPQVITTGSSFSGGRNPGVSFSNPAAGKRGGVVIYKYAETMGDTL